MKCYSRTLAALLVVALTLAMTLSFWPNGAQAKRLLLTQVHSSSASSMTSSSQALKDLQADKKNPSKQVGSSFRRIPPSTSNPTQNKSKPPLDGRRKY